MSLACRIVSVDNSHAYQYIEKKRFWFHNGHLPVPDNNLSVHAMMFGGDPIPLPRNHLIPLHVQSLHIDPFTDAALSIGVRRQEDCLLSFSNSNYNCDVTNIVYPCLLL